MKKEIIIPSLVLGAIACTGLYGVSSASVSADGTGRNAIVQKIAEKFNLNADEVQTVFKEDRKAHQVQMQEKQEERLAQAVSEGKLSGEQKQLIIDKMAELKTERDANQGNSQDLTKEERQAERKAHQEEMTAWLTENGIDQQYLGGHQGGMRGGQKSGGFGK
jgi:folate-dependent phosphoribosylglycinamide formyltransferase PurN